jgi:hypothetical protein
MGSKIKARALPVLRLAVAGALLAVACPRVAAHVLPKLDSEGLLGRQLFVVGTHALFAYEAASGVLFDAGLTATTDVDLLWDVRRRLSLAMVDVRAEGVLGLLRKVDGTFTAQRNSFRAVNDKGYYVDLIRPLEKDKARSTTSKISDADDDLEAAAISGLQWLVYAPPSRPRRAPLPSYSRLRTLSG